MASKTDDAVPEIHRFDGLTAEIGGRTWINGIGNAPCDVVLVDTWPSDDVRRSRRPFTDRSGRVLTNLLREAGLSPQRCYATYAVKFPAAQGRKPSARDRKLCQTMLREEIARADPRVVVALGSDAWASLVDVRAYPHGKSRGEPLEIDGRTYFATFNLGQVMLNGGEYFRDGLSLDQVPPHVVVHDAVREMRIVRDLADGIDVRAAWDDARPSYRVVRTAQEAKEFREYLQATYDGGALICLDCEWEGDNWLDPKRYIRTIQMGFDKGLAVIFELADAGGADVTDDRALVMGEIRAILEWERTGVVGHNVIADGQWLLQEGIDIRDRVVYDTMLGQYLLGEDGPFGLEECAMRHAPYGRYCGELERWVHTHAKECRHGFGAVPRDILLPYGAADVDCLRYIMEAQIPRIRALGYMEPRGTAREYPSLLDETLNTQRVLYELEGTGMPVDRERLNSMIDAFQSKKAELLAQVVSGAAVAGMPDFNPGSSAQVRKLLFEVLGLPPVKTTAGKDWAESVGNRGLDEELDVSAATDKQTLEILGDRHPLVHALLQFRRIDQYCKTWLRHADPKNPGRGIEGQMWADGRLHSHMSQLSTTSRFKSSSPNCITGDAEVLTDRGWLRWDEAYRRRGEGLRLAQWDHASPNRDITFAEPLEWHTAYADTVRVRAGKHLDLRCTPNHRFYVYDSATGTPMAEPVCAKDLVNARACSVPQCGILTEAPGKLHLTDAEVTILCATQADVRGGRGVSLRNVEVTPDKPDDVYCATMPLGTLIVKNKGNVLFLGNSQNFPKKAEGFLTEVFGEGNVPPVLRTIIVPPDGMVMMEADFQQAELFTIASLSGDQHMIDVLKTPGRDS